MKVMILTDAWLPQVNGVVRTYQHLIAEMEKIGHTVKVVGPSDFRWTIPLIGYPEIKLAIAPYKHIQKTLEDFEPDRIHISTEGPIGRAARKYCLKHGRKFTTTYHTHFPDYVAKRIAKTLPFLYKPVHSIAKNSIRKFHAPTSAMMVATQSLEDDLRNWNFKNPMHRLTRGAKLDQFYPGEKTLFKDLPGPIALYVGRIAIEKNIEAFLDMPWDGSKVLVGDGPSMAELQQRYPDAHFTGTKEGSELADHYRSADIFVFPSRTDTFGMVIVEALACGLPVAGYDVTGPKDIITEDYLGALHKTDLAIAAKKALNCGSKETCAQHIKDYYTWENAARQFLDALPAQPPDVHKMT